MRRTTPSRSSPIRPRQHHHRRRVRPEGVHVDIGTIASVFRGAGQQHPLGLDAHVRVERDNLALAARALVAAGLAHCAASLRRTAA